MSGSSTLPKPDAAIFEIALARWGVAADDRIFIDNSAKNLRAASEIGMDTVLFNRDNETYDGRVVYSFHELYRLLVTENASTVF